MMEIKCLVCGGRWRGGVKLDTAMVKTGRELQSNLIPGEVESLLLSCKLPAPQEHKCHLLCGTGAESGATPGIQKMLNKCLMNK
jgi:hypothetical protein